MLGSADRGKVRQIIREIVFGRIPARVFTVHQRYRQTDGPTDGQLSTMA